MKAPVGLQIQNPLPGLRTISIQDGLFILLSLFYFMFAFHLYKSSEGLPGFTQSNVDELYFTYLPAFNFYHFGPRNSYFLPDYASGLEPSAHPYVYTHNIAFPNWVAYFFMLLGLKEVWHLSFISIFISYAGYSAGYLFFRKYVGPGVALLLFFMILSNYKEVLTHSLGFFRAFQWILFFAAPYSFLEWSRQPESRIHTLFLFLSLLLAVSYEYTFALQLYILLICLYFYNVYGCSNLVPLWRLLLIMFMAFIIPWGLQAFTVYWIFGPEMFLYDDLATLSNRLLPEKNPRELATYYAEKGILFWVYGNKPGPLVGIPKLLTAITTTYGGVSTISALAVVCLHVGSKKYTSIRKILDEFFSIDPVAIVGCMILSFFVYIGVFYYHIYMVYVDSGVPLIEMYTISATSLVIYLLYRLIARGTNSVYFRALFIGVLLFIQFSQFTQAYYHNPPLPMAAHDVLPKYEGKSFITSYHSVYPTIFTKQWVIPNWSGLVTPENIHRYGFYVWLKDNSSTKGEKYSHPEYYLHIYRRLASPIDIKVKDTFELVEKGDNYGIYKLR